MNTKPLNRHRSHPSITDAGTSRFRSVLQIGLVLLLTVGLVGPVQAQDRAPDPSGDRLQKTESPAPSWLANFGEQAGRLLEEETSATVRETILQNLIRITGRRPSMDLSETVAPLLHVLDTASDSEHRIMALHALHNIDPEAAGRTFYRQAMAQVNKLMKTESSERVRRVALATLASYVSERTR